MDLGICQCDKKFYDFFKQLLKLRKKGKKRVVNKILVFMQSSVKESVSLGRLAFKSCAS